MTLSSTTFAGTTSNIWSALPQTKEPTVPITITDPTKETYGLHGQPQRHQRCRRLDNWRHSNAHFARSLAANMQLTQPPTQPAPTKVFLLTAGHSTFVTQRLRQCAQSLWCPGSNKLRFCSTKKPTTTPHFIHPSSLASTLPTPMWSSCDGNDENYDSNTGFFVTDTDEPVFGTLLRENKLQQRHPFSSDPTRRALLGQQLWNHHRHPFAGASTDHLTLYPSLALPRRCHTTPTLLFHLNNYRRHHSPSKW